MTTQSSLRLLISALLLASPLAQAAPIAKQLAGPPSEFAAMAEADLSEAAVESKSALIPIKLEASKEGGWHWDTLLPVEGNNLRLAVFTGAAEDWRLSMRSPGQGFAQPVSTMAAEQAETLFGMGTEEYPADYYSFDNIQSGEWAFNIDAASATQREGFVLIQSESPHRLISAQVARNQMVGQRIGFTANALTLDTGFTAQKNPPSWMSHAVMRVTGPDGESWTELMFDDGLHQDGKAGDGLFGGDFLAQSSGDYTVQVIAQGFTSDGAPVLRTAEHYLPVINNSVNLASQFATSSVLSDTRMGVQLALDNRQDQGQYRVMAEVWGHDERGQEQAIAWIGGMVEANNGQLELGLDARWIGLAGVSKNFELRNVRIEDPNHFIPVARAEKLTLDMPQMPRAAFTRVNQIDEAMRMGVRPDQLEETGLDEASFGDSTRGSGSGLLLVHGYCSKGPWGAVAGHFSGESIFLDLNQNRSHNDFAIRIRNFGNRLNSYGIVASSQGGAASLHLYTYYWSGLDRASGGRLIQSVGTPYRGTSLAGNLAVLGRIFGQGCGRNSNLTYSGAAAWLSGIPGWARSKVNFYTTQFRDRRFRYDYCHIVTDLLLQDPDDGTTEFSRGILPGAAFRGHKMGWCHTDNMRWPAQTRDFSRNSEMNANAAR